RVGAAPRGTVGARGRTTSGAPKGRPRPRGGSRAMSLISLALMSVVPWLAPIDPADPAVAWSADLGPRGFIENRGQFDARARFVGWHDFGTSTVTSDGLRFAWRDGWATFLTFEGANADARVEGRSVRPEPAHFFRGRDPAGWRTDVPVVDTVVWRDLYPGIDAFAHWSRNGLEYDFEVAAGAAVEEIVVRVDGVT